MSSGGLPLSDLGPAVDEVGEVQGIDHLDGGLVELVVRLPGLAAAAQPGQFAQLRVGEGVVPLLRRPFSVAWVDGESCAFVFEAGGEGTRRLAALRTGDSLRSLGPLGRGFDVGGSDSGALLCVAGGLGCAPFPLLAARARTAGRAVVVLSGAATARRLYPAERFQRGDAAVVVEECTDDGSRGARGLVTALLEHHLLDAAGPVTVAACGPNPMLAAVARAVAASPNRVSLAEVSMEAPMGCGFGTCLGCALPVVGPDGAAWALCCRQGPVMPAQAVDWDALRLLPPAHVA